MKQETPKILMNDKIFETEIRFEALVTEAAIGIIIADEKGEILLSNKFANHLFGYEKDELTNQNISELIPEAVREQHLKHHENYVAKPQIRPMGIGLDLNGRRKDGSQFPVEISLSFFTQNEKKIFIAFITDVSQKREAEEELIAKTKEIEKLNEGLETEVQNRTKALVEILKDLESKTKLLEKALAKEKELGELKSRFVTMASHEFRSPLTSIMSSAALIEKYNKEEEQEKREKNLNRIKASVINLTDILEEFLSVGKLEEGKVVANMKAFDLTELIHSIIADLKDALKKEQKIVFEGENENIVLLDKSLIRKVLINLLSNAIKFSKDSGTIKIIAKNNANELTVSIKDNGIGISTDDQMHLFDRFFRGTNVANIQGTGLGLHIVGNYTKLMNGQVILKSELGVGTEVTICFKL